MRVALVQPNYRTGPSTGGYDFRANPPLGLCYLSAVLKQNGIETKIIDANAFNLTPEQVAQQVKDFDIVGVSLLSPAFDFGIRLAKLLPKNVIKVAGNSHATGYYKETLESGFDIVVIGEGEYTLLDIALGKDLSKIDGIAYRDKDGIHINKPRKLVDPNIIPFPDREALVNNGMDKPYLSFMTMKTPFAPVVTSRGCPFSCYFCVLPDMNVITRKGIHNFTELNNNMEVLNDEGIFEKFESINVRDYRGEIVKIKPICIFDEIKVTPSHQILIIKKENIKRCPYKDAVCHSQLKMCPSCKYYNSVSLEEYNNLIEKIDASEIKKGDYLIVPIPQVTKDIEFIDCESILLSNSTIYNKKARKIDEDSIDRIRTKYEKYKSINRIAKEESKSRNFVKKRLEKNLNENIKYNIKLMKNDGKLRWKLSRKQISSHIKLDESFLRFIGYYLAEGHINKYKNRPNSYELILTFNKNEKEYIDDCVRIIENVFNEHPRILISNNTTRIMLANSLVGYLFNRLFGSNSNNKKFPPEYFFLPSLKQKEILIGLLNGDGYKTKKGIYSYATASKNLFEFVFYSLLRLGIMPMTYKFTAEQQNNYAKDKNRRIKAKSTCYRIDFDRKIFFNQPKKNKRDKQSIKLKNKFLVPIRRISKEDYKGPVYNLVNVGNNHTYTINFVSVGNCFKISGRQWRARTPENVLDEIDLLVNKYKVKEIDIADDAFNIDLDRAKKICDMIIERKYKLIIRCTNGLRANFVDEEFMKKMKKAGCNYMAFGVESLVQEILDRIPKGETVEEIIRAFKLAKKVGIKTTAFIIFGLEGDTKQTMQTTIDRVKKDLKPNYVNVSIMTPYPGSRLYDKVKKDGKLYTEDFSQYAHTNPRMLFTHPDFPSPELTERMFKKAFKEFYADPRFIARNIISIRNWFDFKQAVGGGKAIINMLKRK